jgi:hypothetical protein
MEGSFPKWETAIFGVDLGLKERSQNPKMFSV